MGFHVDLKEFNEVLAKIQKDTSKTNNQLEQAQRALNGIIQADAMQGATGNAIVNDINNNQSAVVTGLKVTNEFLIAEMLTTLKDFQSTTGESDENAVILEDALLQTQNKLSNLQPKKHEMDSRISNIYNSVNDLISLSMPRSQFDEKLVAASKELEDTIQKVQQFESKKAESNAEKILDKLNNQVQMAREMGSLSYTDPQLQAFFAQDALAKDIHEIDTKITKAENEAKLQAEGEMKKKQEEWVNHHPAEAWLQGVFASIGEKWDGLEKGTRWLGMLGTNYPALKRLSDETLMLEGFIGKAGSAISEFAIGGIKVGFLLAELADWGYNSIRGVEIEQWKLDDLDATWQGVKKLTEYGIVGSITNTAPFLSDFLNNPALTDKIPVLDNLARTFRRDQKEMSNAVKDYVEKALTDHYAFGGVGFDIISCLFGVGEVNTAVKGSAAAGKIAEGENVFQAAGKRGKIGGKSEEVTALMNKLPNSIVEKIKNIEIPNLFEPSYAGIGGERKTLGELFSVAKSETKGTGNTGEVANEAEKLARKLEEARAQQRTVIESVESGEVVLKTTKRKGNYGEMKMDDFFESQTYTRISDDRVLTLDQKIVKGIDAVYENASPPPKYVIAEAKYNTSKLGKTNDGKQMSEDWILGSERLDSTLSKEKADEIVAEMVLNPENVQRVVIQVMPDGTIVKKILEV
ncbi:T7SS effector LXG polymorphic toxin [Bacillus paramycoides]|uniref:T7SS effector LXG polymorphic toxin n=1 Tax=Bacillus paramycoides TaxID=2026194 RepID=UPI0011A35D90|nr:T7SS effector LXG polymorphic toxin [Bacillus paramycoides]